VLVPPQRFEFQRTAVGVLSHALQHADEPGVDVGVVKPRSSSWARPSGPSSAVPARRAPPRPDAAMILPSAILVHAFMQAVDMRKSIDALSRIRVRDQRPASERARAAAQAAQRARCCRTSTNGCKATPAGRCRSFPQGRPSSACACLAALRNGRTGERAHSVVRPLEDPWQLLHATSDPPKPPSHDRIDAVPEERSHRRSRSARAGIRAYRAGPWRDGYLQNHLTPSCHVTLAGSFTL
jgi:hypothetical protein